MTQPPLDTSDLQPRGAFFWRESTAIDSVKRHGSAPQHHRSLLPSEILDAVRRALWLKAQAICFYNRLQEMQRGKGHGRSSCAPTNTAHPTTAADYYSRSRDATGKYFKTHYRKIAVKRKDAKNPESLHSGCAKGIMIADALICISRQYLTCLAFIIRLESE